jgi:NAD(P)-dependent dehydrogenase (short-subunit alcohol dehydrogenase family)
LLIRACELFIRFLRNCYDAFISSILITGTSSGIGHAATLRFASKGWTVFAGSRNPEGLIFDHPKAKSHIIPVAIDVSDPASIASCFATLSKKAHILDAVVNNAGLGLLLPFEMFRVNVFGLMEVSRQAVKVMRPQKRGTIVNVSSVLGLVGMPFYAAYSATKWAVEGFSESLAHEVEQFGIRIKIVEPSGTKTEFHHQAYDTDGCPVSEPYKAWYEGKKNKSGHDRAEGRYATSEEIAALIENAVNDSSPHLRRFRVPETRQVSWGQRLLGRDWAWRVIHRRFVPRP